jgi:hypothetical protein
MKQMFSTATKIKSYIINTIQSLHIPRFIPPRIGEKEKGHKSYDTFMEDPTADIRQINLLLCCNVSNQLLHRYVS